MDSCFLENISCTIESNGNMDSIWVLLEQMWEPFYLIFIHYHVIFPKVFRSIDDIGQLRKKITLWPYGYPESICFLDYNEL